MDIETQPTERDRSSRSSGSEQPSDPAGPEERSRSALAGRIADWVPGGRITVTLLVLLLFLLLVSTFVLKPFQIPSGSMERGLRIGDRVLVNKLAYRFDGRPQRGDVVVFDGTGLFGHGDYIKRVVGVGGDHVVCCDREGRIRVNGRSVDESAFLYPGDRPSTVGFDVVVPDGTLFVLGDHRSGSSDSRDHLGSPGGGMIPVDRLIGRADWIVWPFGHATHLDRPDAYADVPDAEAGAVSGPAGEREAGGDSGAAGGWGAGGVSGAAGGGVRRAESVDG
ncbi:MULTISPECIES: signal peptidase I [Streptomyces]|uniref:signal peptidase I n=1 Tax=Streptomyces TaxID=1883 RepID=UPI0018A8818E|nr:MULTISPECIES: signal peptidase I [Streptomyces]MBF8170446.1 signal peptidase I [Streptomyces olivaceus]WFB85615.1 signal peptidase I [Streptomyces olivaceus]WGK48759.1 signal peptidase I [Streptomyces sp. B146]